MLRMAGAGYTMHCSYPCKVIVKEVLAKVVLE